MSVDNVNDEELPPEPGGSFAEPGGRFGNLVVVGFYLPDGKLVTIQDFTIYADHCLTADEIDQELNVYIGPLYAKLAGYPRLVQASGGQISWQVLGTTCEFGSE